MPDIAMCYGQVVGGIRVCTKRDRCYRYTATPTPRRQSYLAVLHQKQDGGCEYFMETGVVRSKASPVGDDPASDLAVPTEKQP